LTRIPKRVIELACAHSEALAEAEDWNWRLERAQQIAGGALDIRFDVRFKFLCEAKDRAERIGEELRLAES